MMSLIYMLHIFSKLGYVNQELLGKNNYTTSIVSFDWPKNPKLLSFLCSGIKVYTHLLALIYLLEYLASGWEISEILAF